MISQVTCDSRIWLPNPHLHQTSWNSDVQNGIPDALPAIHFIHSFSDCCQWPQHFPSVPDHNPYTFPSYHMDTICWLSHQSVSRTLSPLNTSNTSPRVQIHIISCLDHSDCLLPTPSFHPCPLTFSMLGPERALSNTHESQLFSSIHLPPAHSSASKPKFLKRPARSPVMATSSLTLLMAFFSLEPLGTHSWSTYCTLITSPDVCMEPSLFSSKSFTSDISSLRPSRIHQSHSGGCLPSRLVRPPVLSPHGAISLHHTI